MASTKRTEAAAATKAKILDVARGLFTRQGFEHTNLRQISAIAGYSTGAVFASWASKEALFQAAMGEPAPDACGFLDRLVRADEATQDSGERSLALYELAKAARVLRVHLVGTPE